MHVREPRPGSWRSLLLLHFVTSRTSLPESGARVHLAISKRDVDINKTSSRHSIQPPTLACRVGGTGVGRERVMGMGILSFNPHSQHFLSMMIVMMVIIIIIFI